MIGIKSLILLDYFRLGEKEMSHTKYTVIRNITECNTYPNLECKNIAVEPLYIFCVALLSRFAYMALNSQKQQSGYISRNWLKRNNAHDIYTNNETLMNLHNFTISNCCKPCREPNKKNLEKVLQFLEIGCNLDSG